MTVCLLKRIFNLIENEDQKCISTVCLFSLWKSAVETNRIIYESYGEHTVFESICQFLIPKVSKWKFRC